MHGLAHLSGRLEQGSAVEAQQVMFAGLFCVGAEFLQVDAHAKQVAMAGIADVDFLPTPDTHHIVGIGPARRKALWSAFGSIAKIKAASVEELAAVSGMNQPAAEAVYHFFAVQREWKGETSYEIR